MPDSTRRIRDDDSDNEVVAKAADSSRDLCVLLDAHYAALQMLVDKALESPDITADDITLIATGFTVGPATPRPMPLPITLDQAASQAAGLCKQFQRALTEVLPDSIARFNAAMAADPQMTRLHAISIEASNVSKHLAATRDIRRFITALDQSPFGHHFLTTTHTWWSTHRKDDPR